MTEHYYTQTPSSQHEEKSIIFEALAIKSNCVTDAGVFSRGGLDMGTRILLEAMPAVSAGESVLDLGCGWGPVGVTLGQKYPEADITMTDVNERAVELSIRNLKLNGVKNAKVFQSDVFTNIENTFDRIVLNPPIRAGKSVIYAMFSDAKEHLKSNGTLYIVIRKQQGAESAEKYLKTVYAKVERIARDKGYWVLRCEKSGDNE